VARRATRGGRKIRRGGSAMRGARLAVALLPLALAGCPDDITTPFDPSLGYQPIEACTAAFPAGTPEDPHPEQIEIVADWREGRLAYAHGAAYLHATPREVLEALRDPAVSRIHSTDSWGVTGDEEPGYPITFSIRYGAGPALYQAHWTIVYRGGALEGTADAPAEVGLRYQKVEGVEDIRVQSGSLVASDAGDGVTTLQFVCHLDTSERADQGPGDVRGTVNDWFEGRKAKVHGQPVP
jgi:hypothetical protein